MSNPNKFPSRITHIQKNDPVTAGVASGPDKILDARTNYLKTRIDEIEAGRALIWENQTLASNVLEGQPVYWNHETLQWELALASVVECTDTSTLTAEPSSNCKGLLLRKRSGDVGDIVLWGVVFFKDQLQNAIDDTPIEPGDYYLSSVEAGKMTLQKPPVTVSVCCVLGPLDDCDENTWVYVRPDMKDFLENHIHHQFDLVARPAGDVTPPLIPSCHTIENADETKMGWLPANHSSFNGFAPTGAKFGYNIRAHEALDRNWAPVPTSAAVLEMLHDGAFGPIKGIHQDAILDFPSISGNSFAELSVTIIGTTIDDAVLASPQGGPTGDGVIQAWVSAADTITIRYTNPTGGALDPPSQTYHIEVFKDPTGPEAVKTSFGGLMRVPPELVQIDKNGIWWMTDCYNQVPWPTNLDTTGSSSSSSSMSSSSMSSSSSSAQLCSGDCPVDDVMRLTLSFIKMTFLAQKTVVTALQPDTDQPLRFVNCDGDDATTGELFAQLVLALLVEDEFLGGQVLKGITADNKFQRGWATEGLIAGTNVTISSTRNRLLDPTAPASVNNPVVHQEIVTVNSSLDPLNRELNPQIVVLGDAVERTYDGIQYIGFKNGQDSGVRLKFHVPPEGLPTTPQFVLRVQIFGRAAGQLTDLETLYKISVRPDGITTPTPIVDTDIAFGLATNITVLADNIYEIESDPISVAAGDTIYIAINRLSTGTPVYAAEIGLHRFGGMIVDGS
jgi:hypothetical protein